MSAGLSQQMVLELMWIPFLKSLVTYMKQFISKKR